MKINAIITASVLTGSFLFALNASGAIKNGLDSKYKQKIEVLEICLPPRDVKLTPPLRQCIADRLGWQQQEVGLCQGFYSEPLLTASDPSKPQPAKITADNASIYIQGRTTLQGNVMVEQPSRQVSANTAYVYRDAKTKQVTKIELLGNVKYQEHGRLMLAKKAIINPDDKAGQVYEVIYRLARGANPIVDGDEVHWAGLTGWGRASKIERFKNGDSQLDKATYSTCPPRQNAWKIQATKINLDKEKGEGVARNATLRVKDIPIFYTPYLSFPTDNRRKSGFLMPVAGYTNQAGFDLATPYYWNMAPNYDAVITPHYYSRRGFMLGGDFRYLTTTSTGAFGGDFLANDRVYKNFLLDNQDAFPELRGASSNRWAVRWLNNTQLGPHWNLNVDFQQVSDDYYLQDFSSNLAWTTENQLLRQGFVTYSDSHWVVRGGLQSYQTLHPINQTVTADAYQRLPQITASGTYAQLPMNLLFQFNGEYDYFLWPVSNQSTIPQGSRYHANPLLSMPLRDIWGFVVPTVQLQQNNYDLSKYNGMQQSFSRTISQFNVDGGLIFERDLNLFNHAFTQTLEPRLYYLYTPYVEQHQIPTFDAGYYIFNYAQLFRPNRFSGIDRVGDANQLSYAVTSRFLSETGVERASLSIGQIAYFRDRKVQLCFDPNAPCVDAPTTQLDYSSPTAKYSPIAGALTYYLWSPWSLTANLAWDPDARRTVNGGMNLQYNGPDNRILYLGYTYMVNGDTNQVADSSPTNYALNQIMLSYAWPFNGNWSSLGSYGYNFSKRFDMTYLLGVQYDSCCWAARLIGGKVYRDINEQRRPNYTNSIYLQVLLKGLGSVTTTDPSSVIGTYIPGYLDIFHH